MSRFSNVKMSPEAVFNQHLRFLADNSNIDIDEYIECIGSDERLGEMRNRYLGSSRDSVDNIISLLWGALFDPTNPKAHANLIIGLIEELQPVIPDNITHIRGGNK